MEIAANAAETGYRCVPVSTEILSDVRTPIEVLRILKGESDHVYMLESCGDSEKWGRYTFLGMEPTLEVTCLDGIVSVTGKDRKAAIHRVRCPWVATATVQVTASWAAAISRTTRRRV